MEPVRVEYRGVSGELSAGDTVIVESCEAGVLVLRHAPPPPTVTVTLPDPSAGPANEKSKEPA